MKIVTVDIAEEDLKYFLELLTFHESEILSQLENCKFKYLKKALELENEKCVKTAERILNTKERCFDKIASDFESLFRNINRGHRECSLSAARSIKKAVYGEL